MTLLRPLTLIVALAALCVGIQAKAAQPLPVIQTQEGPVRGFEQGAVTEYRGIPFAAPPVGARRFEPPAPVTPWTKVLDAKAYGSPCPQAARYGLTEASDDESCLFLNVAVPKTQAKAKRPVIVWLYGGAFVGGSGTLYPLAHWAERGDVVLVSANYRLGPLGFMAHPAFGASHNGGYALEDQRAALRWVQRNIAKFGGDPNNVTLAGESAGAASVCMQMFAPKEAAGLFHKAIIQSAGCTVPLRTVAQAQSTGLKVAALVGCDDPATALACLRTKSAKALVDAATQVAGTELMSFSPIVGSQALPEQGTDLLASGKLLRMPVINGGNRDEMRLYVAYDVQAGGVITSETYLGRLKALYGDKAAAVQAQYPLANYPSATVALGTAMSDFMPNFGLNSCVFLKAGDAFSAHMPVYQYEFADRAAPLVTTDVGFEQGAVHSAELPYFFPRFDNTSKLTGPDLAAPSQGLSDQMIDYWSHFARDGHPWAKGAPVWSAYRSARSVIRFEPGKTRNVDLAADHHCDFWRGLYPDQL